MNETPPAQITTAVSSPPTPRHGAAYDGFDTPRYSTRSVRRKISHDASDLVQHSGPASVLAISTSTPKLQRKYKYSSPEPTSPHISPPRTTRRVQIASPRSPSSPESNMAKGKGARSLQTTINGMLPTPAKTPRKKIVTDVKPAARALFQDEPLLGEDSSYTKRGRKNRRFNGFSLESFAVDDDNSRGKVQIFTDSRDKVPEAATKGDNPFLQEKAAQPSSKKARGSTKRRKISGEARKDPQVQQAIEDDEGMVYVFRGKKVYRKFDDHGDIEEDIDVDELGLLQHVEGGSEIAKPIKSLTRKSIRPKRLFQQDAAGDEEAPTDIEEVEDLPHEDQTAPLTPMKVVTTPASPPTTGRSLRSSKRKGIDEEEAANERVEQVKTNHAARTSSPFDAWRKKKVVTPASGVSIKSRKRQVQDESTPSGEDKRVRID